MVPLWTYSCLITFHLIHTNKYLYILLWLLHSLKFYQNWKTLILCSSLCCIQGHITKATGFVNLSSLNSYTVLRFMTILNPFYCAIYHDHPHTWHIYMIAKYILVFWFISRAKFYLFIYLDMGIFSTEHMIHQRCFVNSVKTDRR